MVALQDLGGLDAFPGGGDLDEDPVFRDTLLLVELQGQGVVSIVVVRVHVQDTYVDDVQGLLYGRLCVEGEAGIDLGGDLAGDDL